MHVAPAEEQYAWQRECLTSAWPKPTIQMKVLPGFAPHKRLREGQRGALQGATRTSLFSRHSSQFSLFQVDIGSSYRLQVALLPFIRSRATMVCHSRGSSGSSIPRMARSSSALFSTNGFTNALKKTMLTLQHTKSASTSSKNVYPIGSGSKAQASQSKGRVGRASHEPWSPFSTGDKKSYEETEST